MTLPIGRRRRYAFVVLAILASLSACRRETPDEVDSETVVTVKTAPASLGTILSVVQATGVVSAAPGAELVVIAPEAARIVEIPRATGDLVKRGDVLVRFEIPSTAAEVEKQQAEIVRAQATLQSAHAAETRARELFEHGVAARREMEEAGRAVADAEAALAQARVSLTAAQTVASRSVVRATFDGIVAARLHNPGDLVEPAANDVVLRVLDLRRLEVIASVPLSQASRVRVGAPAHLTSEPAGADGSEMRVLTRPASMEVGTAAISVRLGFTGSPNLPVGAPVQVDIEAERHADIVVVPVAAIVREGEDTAVLVARGAKAERRPVRLGLGDGAQVEVASGLKVGELVIVDGQAGLPDGAAIAPAPADPRNTPAEAKDEK